MGGGGGPIKTQWKIGTHVSWMPLNQKQWIWSCSRSNEDVAQMYCFHGLSETSFLVQQDMCVCNKAGYKIKVFKYLVLVFMHSNFPSQLLSAFSQTEWSPYCNGLIIHWKPQRHCISNSELYYGFWKLPPLNTVNLLQIEGLNLPHQSNKPSRKVPIEVETNDPVAGTAKFFPPK